MVTLIDRKYIGDGKWWCEYAGESSDTKPVDTAIYSNSYFTEVDTGKLFYFDGDAGAWKPFGGDSDGN